MATKKISELNALTTPESDDLIAIVDTSATETKKITYGNISKHIVNVGTEVEEDSRINFIHSKNLNDGINRNVFINASANQCNIYQGNAGTYLILEEGIYTISTTTTQTKYRVACANEIPGSTLITCYNGVNKDNTSNNITINTTGYKYLFIDATDISKIQVEQGNTASPFEPYTQNQIVVDNEKYTDTLNVGTDVDSRSRVNVLHSKNLFNASIQAGTYESVTYSVASDGLITQSASDSSNWNINQNRIFYLDAGTYTISIDVKTGAKGYMQLYNLTDSADVVSTTGNSKTFTLNGRKALGFKTYGSGGTYPVSYYVMINKGSSALPYEPYIVPSINVDGENEFFKNVYSTSEVVIGEWLGKPLYRKVIEITNPTLDAWTNVNHNISNMDFGRIVDATITRTIYGTTSYIPIGVSNISAGTLFTCDLQKTIFEYKIAGYTNITNLNIVLEYTKTTD